MQICWTLSSQLQYNTFECNTLMSDLSQNRWIEKELEELGVFSLKGIFMIISLIFIYLGVNCLRFMFSSKWSLKITTIKWLIRSEVQSFSQKESFLTTSQMYFKRIQINIPLQVSFLIFLFCSFFDLKSASILKNSDYLKKMNQQW